MDNNPFEIPPLMSSSTGATKGFVAGGKENVRSTIQNNGTSSKSSSSSMHQPSKYSRHSRLPQDGNKAASSSKSPNWNGKFSSSLSTSPGIPSQSTTSKRKLGSGSKLLSNSSSSSSSRNSRPLRSLMHASTSRPHHHSSPQSRLSPPVLSSSPLGPILPQSSSTLSASKYPIPSSASKLKEAAVLRHGETMNGFFGINHDSSEDYIQLVESLVDGSRANDPSTWCKVLDMAAQGNTAIAPLYLVRMHRRATMRFRLEPQELAELSKERHRQEVLQMWVSNAQAYAISGNVVEARNTFQHIDNKTKALQDIVGTPAVVSFYLAFAAFESDQGHDKNHAKEILLRGIDATKDPDGKLQQRLAQLDRTFGNEASCKRNTPKTAEKNRAESHGTPLSRTRKSDTISRSTIKFHSSLLEPALQEKARSATKRPFGGLERISPKKNVASRSASRSPKRHRPLEHRHEQKEEKKTAQPNGTADNAKHQGSPLSEARKIVSIRSPKNIASQATEMRTVAGATAAVVTATETGLGGKPPTASTKKRSSLTSRLVRKGLSGAPKRVEADQSLALDDEDLSSDDSDAESACGEEDTKVPSFKSMDLSYIWDWKPKGMGNNDQTGAAMGNAQATQASGESSDDSGAASKLKENDELEKKEKEALKQPVKTEEKYKSGTQAKSSLKETADSQAVAVMDEREARKQRLMEKANLDFLPLVHEDNILRVNRHSYVKLGAIGKGGSCKVYRALSKKCSVVAIKKVKLEGMDKKQIEGYANEISLLKRLRGNSSIIQMYDSELDLKRKSLFVVMELGEVDLNYVLQQRAKANTSKSLDMNFIRLTWQQMLTAVHCIHQEKIIHSDLKPANFLFVRGALKLIDFGIAKAISNPDDTTKIIRESQIGTLNYMSPESIMDTSGTDEAGLRMKIGRASDVWSLGIILYEMLYGQTPFAQYHLIVKLQAIINENHQIPFPDAGGSAEGAIDAIKQCLRRRPEERPPIVGENGLLNEHWFLHADRRPSK